MNILVIDAQGGGIGRQLVAKLLERIPEADIVAAGTNSMATNAMIKAGAKKAATGENAIRYCASQAEIITGPIGILVANAMLGEISPAIAESVGSSTAPKVLIPTAHCNNPWWRRQLNSLYKTLTKPRRPDRLLKQSYPVFLYANLQE